MKKIKLTLKSETIRVLGVKQLRGAMGGSDDSVYDGSCAPWDCITEDASCYTGVVCPSLGFCETEQNTCFCVPR